ncbi:MAG: hypothetical protein JNJ61_22765 [Anaerolineae bacterium]|nr:hypothetical protein [Anaerolineae bacterium]
MQPLLDLLLRIAVFLAGGALVVYTLLAAIRTFVLPRGDNVGLTRIVFRSVFSIFNIPGSKAKTYYERDRIMALFAPISLLVLPIVWLILIALGYTLMYWAIGAGTFYEAFKISGSSLYTLGFFTVDTLGQTGLNGLGATVLELSEATIGLGLVALLISYLPTMYSAFSKRETLVTMLEVRADSPPSPIVLITRAHSIRGLSYLSELWQEWEVWFSEIDESHTSLGPINFFRSPQPDRSWITAAGTVLDAAALMSSVVNVPRTPEAQLCIRAGFVALRHICDFFGIPYDPDPHFPDHPISITRQEFDEACAELSAAGVPLKEDRDQAWQDFAGWRVNYDTVLLELADLTMAPYAMWSSDRGVQDSRSARRKRRRF